ncbi:hypothetical protein DH2020_004283 [Rehmannia glutinosa]|uniref:Transposase MuDR plant domain-containing protein n=1 Tax=Rehmannia glutinosa TaxID=99300 RepID=A0ABR0XP31_REHGL
MQQQENDNNQLVNWNELQIIRETDSGNDATTEEPSAQRYREENAFTSEHLITSSVSSTSHVIADGDLQPGRVFSTKKELQEAIHFLALKHNFEFKVKKSNKEVYTVVCVDENCKWRLRAIKFHESEFFEIRKYMHEHICSISMTRNDHRQATTQIIGKHIMNKLKNPNTTYRAANLMSDVHHDFGIQMSYQKARRCRKVSLGTPTRFPEDSYANLPAYAHNLAIANPIYPSYAYSIMPATNETEWDVPENIKNINVLPPLVRPHTGRRKTTRIPSTGEFVKRIKCSRCGASGHNRLTCRDQRPLVVRQ